MELIEVNEKAEEEMEEKLDRDEFVIDVEKMNQIVKKGES